MKHFTVLLSIVSATALFAAEIGDTFGVKGAVIVNDTYTLPSDYAASLGTSKHLESLKAMSAAATKECKDTGYTDADIVSTSLDVYDSTPTTIIMTASAQAVCK